ncbi:MAG: chromosomal replication initiator protein DnaA [Treponemataceae bacterium]|nr:chromosomal replication initiator protein DnaA [Treponemataceae bacterium]
MSEFKVIWDEALISLFNDHAQDGSEMGYLMWADKLRFVNADAATITVAVASAFMRDQVIRKNIDKEIQNRITELVGQSYTIQFSIQDIHSLEGTAFPTGSVHAASPQPAAAKPVVSQPVASQPAAPQVQNFSVPSPTPSAPAAASPDLKCPGILPRYTFDNFIVGEENNYAYNAALAISKNPGKYNNPLLIYGGVGLGKTHLMCAIGNYLFHENPKRKVVYVTSEEFLNGFVESMGQKNGPQEFRNKYRKVDALLIDDVQFFQKKEQLQNELFSTFEALYKEEKQMVFTCDRPPAEMKDLDERVRSRLGRGLIVDIQLPSYETRCAIIRQKLKEQNKSLSPEVIDYISKNVTTNIRDLESSISRLISYSEIVNKEITLQLAQEKLKDILNPLTVGNVSIDIIIKVVANEYGLTPADLKKKNATKQVAFARQMAIYIARELTELSTTELGVEFNRDHSTIAHSLDKVENMLKTDEKLVEKKQLLIRSIRDYKNQI